MVTGGVRLGPATLVAVESPLKARAIQEYLGRLDHQVFATEEHIRELDLIDPEGQAAASAQLRFV